MFKVKFFVLLTAILSIIAGFANGTTQASVTANDCTLTSTQMRNQELSHLSQLVRKGYTLTNHALMVQAGVAVKSNRSVAANLMAFKPTAQPPQVEDDGSAGYRAQIWYSLFMDGMTHPYGIRINMNCDYGKGGVAWTGSPPGDRQVGIGVHRSGAISNPASAGCPWYTYSNCMFEWIASSVEGTGLDYIWVAGLYTYPMYVDSWTHCF